MAHVDERAPRWAERVGAEQAERDEEAREEFRRRVAAGEYRRLLGKDLGAIVEQAGAVTGVREELGALRYCMARVLMEEGDPVRQAATVARVAAVSVQAARAQRAIDGDVAASLTEAVTQILHELGEGG